MPDKTLASLTAATAATGGLFYGTQGGSDRKFTLSAVGAAVIEAATAADQRTALGAAGLVANTFTGLQTTAGVDLTTSSTPNNGISFDGASTLFSNAGAIKLALYSTEFILPGQMALSWSSSSAYSSSRDICLSRAGAASLQMGLNHATTPTTQTIKAHDVTTGTGADLWLTGGKGSAAGGSVILATSATNGDPVATLTVDPNGNVVCAHTLFASEINATTFTVSGTPGTSGTITSSSTVTVVNGIITNIA